MLSDDAPAAGSHDGPGAGLNALSSIVCFLTNPVEHDVVSGLQRLNALSSIVCFLTFGNVFLPLVRGYMVSMPSRALYAF